MAKTTDQFLNSQEEWLFKELEILHQIHTEIRDTHLKYQSWFMLTHGVLIAAIVNIKHEASFENSSDFNILIIILGFLLGICGVLLQLRHMSDSKYRMIRIREISNLLRKPLSINKNDGEFMSFIGGDIKSKYRYKFLQYGKIRLFVELIFPILWLVVLLINVL